MGDDESLCDDIIKSLPSPSSLAGYRMVPAEFEKDDDTNHHIDFITACSNLRARNYKIGEADRLKTKQVGTSGMEWTLWDRYDIDEGRELTLREFIDLFKDRYKLEVTMISSGVSILYSFFTNQKKLKERYPMTMSTLVTEVSKTEFKPKQKYITFEICCNDMNAAADDDDEDVEVPYVRYRFVF